MGNKTVHKLNRFGTRTECGIPIYTGATTIKTHKTFKGVKCLRCLAVKNKKKVIKGRTKVRTTKVTTTTPGELV